MKDLNDILGLNDPKTVNDPTTHALLRRLADSHDLTAAIIARQFFEVQGAESAAERLGAIIQKLTTRLVKTHE